MKTVVCFVIIIALSAYGANARVRRGGPPGSEEANQSLQPKPIVFPKSFPSGYTKPETKPLIFDPASSSGSKSHFRFDRYGLTIYGADNVTAVAEGGLNSPWVGSPEILKSMTSFFDQTIKEIGAIETLLSKLDYQSFSNAISHFLVKPHAYLVLVNTANKCYTGDEYFPADTRLLSFKIYFPSGTAKREPFPEECYKSVRGILSAQICKPHPSMDSLIRVSRQAEGGNSNAQATLDQWAGSVIGALQMLHQLGMSMNNIRLSGFRDCSREQDKIDIRIADFSSFTYGDQACQDNKCAASSYRPPEFLAQTDSSYFWTDYDDFQVGSLFAKVFFRLDTEKMSQEYLSGARVDNIEKCKNHDQFFYVGRDVDNSVILNQWKRTSHSLIRCELPRSKLSMVSEMNRRCNSEDISMPRFQVLIQDLDEKGAPSGTPKEMDAELRFTNIEISDGRSKEMIDHQEFFEALSKTGNPFSKDFPITHSGKQFSCLPQKGGKRAICASSQIKAGKQRSDYEEFQARVLCCLTSITHSPILDDDPKYATFQSYSLDEPQKKAAIAKVEPQAQPVKIKEQKEQKKSFLSRLFGL